MIVPSPLQGGARRRRRPGPLLLAILLALALAAGALTYDRLGAGGRGHAGADAQATAKAPPPPAQPGSRYAVALDAPDAFRLRLHDPPRAGLVFDLDSGRVLWRRNPRRRLPIASLTKIMTALVVVDRARARDEVRVPKAALDYRGSGVGLLPKGRHVTIWALLNGLLLPSGNDAALALAIAVGGNEHRFVRMMNREARKLGLTCTHYVSPHGLERGNRSCAADLAAMARVAMGRRLIARIVRRRQSVVRFPIEGGRLWLNTTNPLVRTGYPGAIGLKTGDTDAAGHCFVGVVRRGGRRLGVVLLNSPNILEQSRKLLARAFRTRV
ncbi:MAG: D-alanyl-D-alanine carboxypeptidase [Thermoleophilaceae bacterium]|nr:D-alanyl-D-alanine carboxypeptidase [Thermoleophilaceae bacterium]